MTRTYEYNGETITVKGGKIVAASTAYFADGPHFRIGSKITARQLGDFGYRLPRKVTQYDAWGRKVG